MRTSGDDLLCYMIIHMYTEAKMPTMYPTRPAMKECLIFFYGGDTEVESKDIEYGLAAADHY